MQLALLLAFLRLSPGPKNNKRTRTVSPSGNGTPVSRVTGGDTIHYTNEELVTTLFRGRVESRKGGARRLLHGDLCKIEAPFQHQQNPPTEGIPMHYSELQKKRWFIDEVAQTWPFGGCLFFNHSSLLTLWHTDLNPPTEGIPMHYSELQKKRWFIDEVAQTWPFGGCLFFNHSSLLTLWQQLY